ncbi:MAG TPA: Flp family type IVb pilin [Acidimicrobiales bacterium]|nr:Flp family type IVb pilin [Acidimicrobiales bacterium]
MDMIRYMQRVFMPAMRAKYGKTERGAALVEYALLLALIAVVCIVALQFLGSKSAEKFSKVGNSIAGA